MNAVEYLKLFKDFPDRETKLRAITRYSLYPVMFYRTNLWTHSKRVAWITEVIAPSAQAVWPDFNIEKAILMAIVHDDQAIIMGDIQAGNKAKMTAEQLKWMVLVKVCMKFLTIIRTLKPILSMSMV